MRIASRGHQVALVVALIAMVLALADSAAAEVQNRLWNQIVLGNMVRFSVVDGRITPEASRLGAMSTRFTSKQANEEITFNSENGQPTLKYSRADKIEQFTIDIDFGERRLAMRMAPKGKSKQLAVEFSQATGEPLMLKIGEGAEQRTVQSPNLWQLLITEPADCRQQLLPLLEMLRPNWRLDETTTEIEKKLVASANHDPSGERARWAALVGQLGDQRYARREAADRALRAGDAVTRAYLNRLDFGQLDAEQQFRVGRIIQALGGQTDDDSPDQAAAELAAEPAVWLALLTRADLPTRKAAVRQLATLLGEPVAFDPSADSATRKAQWEKLRARIEGR